MGRWATRISHAGTKGVRSRAPFVGKLTLGRPANDNVAPPRSPMFWGRLAAAALSAGLIAWLLA